MQSFLMFFYILDQCYDLYQENDLGGFLGTISPELWNDGKPIDAAIYTDWKNQINIKSINKQNIVDVTYAFLENYERLYGYNFKETKNILISFVDDEVISRASEYAARRYEKYFHED